MPAFKGKPTYLKAQKKKPITKKEQWAIYGLSRPAAPRYQGLKGIYWNVVSEYVRRRDFGMWGRCVSCNKRVDDWHDLQAGHFIAAGTGGFNLLFDMTNINGECGYCNGFDQNHLVGYERNLDKRYGKDTAEKLKRRYLKSRRGTPQKQWDAVKFDREIRLLQGELAML